MSVNVRVEARRLPPNATKADKDRAIQNLLRVLKRACNDAGVTHEFSKHERFIRKCDIRRQKLLAKRRAPMEAELKAKENAKKSYGRN